MPEEQQAQMPVGFRFRIDWRDRVILQRRVEWSPQLLEKLGISCRLVRWRDAYGEELNDFFNHHRKPK